jgi:autotransporter-associated beta strand protein
VKPLKLLLAASFLLTSHFGYAGSATWNLNATSSDWFNPQNWTPATVPQEETDDATFDLSNSVGVSSKFSLFINSLIFNSGASAFTITVGGDPLHLAFFRFGGPGIVNNSSLTQKFLVTSQNEDNLAANAVVFLNSSSAGSLTQFTTLGGSPGSQIGGEIDFYATSSAGSATLINNPGVAPPGTAGLINFLESSSAGNATIINNGASVTSVGASFTIFWDDSTAGNASITVNSGVITEANGAALLFFNASTAANSILTCNGSGISGAGAGGITFWDTSAAGNATVLIKSGTGGGSGGHFEFAADSDGGTARVEVFGNGFFGIGGHNSPGVSIGSLEGDGLVSLGTNNLILGGNNLNTTFSGVVQDTGSITKVGTGRWIVSGANSYMGGTTLNGGTLLVSNTAGSGLGTGPVQALSGILGGTGIISGRVTMGTGRGTGVTLGPGDNSVIPGILTIGKQLAFKSDATYRVTVKSSTPVADQLIANGVRIIGAQIVFNEVSSATLPPGTTLTVIGNTSSKPIKGTFTNLPDGGSVMVGNNTFQANYEGGDGNDLTLTVVP